MKLATLNELYLDKLKDVYDAEALIIDPSPR